MRLSLVLTAIHVPGDVICRQDSCQLSQKTYSRFPRAVSCDCSVHLRIDERSPTPQRNNQFENSFVAGCINAFSMQ